MGYNKETKMYDGYIYKITNINDVNQKYIGQTSRTVQQRFKEHFYKTQIRGADANFININDFTIETIEVLSCKTILELYDLLDSREQYWIEYYDSYNNGYNKTLGGQLERYLPNNPEILVYDRQGNFLCKYRNITDASFATGANRTRISKSCKSGNKYFLANNYIFRYDGDNLTDEQVNEIKLRYPLIYQYSIEGVLVNTFDSFSFAAKYLRDKYGYNVYSRDLSSVCNKDNLTAYGFVWRKYPFRYEDCSVIIKRRIEQRSIIDGSLIEVYDTIVQGAKMTGANASQIGQILSHNNRYISGGFYWCYEGDFNQEIFDNIIIRSNAPVGMFDVDMNLIATFNTIKDANIFITGSYDFQSPIYTAIGKNGMAYGYYWKYLTNRPGSSKDSYPISKELFDRLVI